MVSKYKNHKKGWFNESYRHSLARKGIITKTNYASLGSFMRQSRKTKMDAMKNRNTVKVPLSEQSMISVKKILDEKGVWRGYVGEDSWAIMRAKDFDSLFERSSKFVVEASEAEGQVGYDKDLDAYVAMLFTAG